MARLFAEIMNPTVDAVENPYLALRAAKIARNHQKLKDLGLLKSQQHHQTPPITTKRARSGPLPQPTRRSNRSSSRPATFNEDELHADASLLIRKRPRRVYSETTESVEKQGTLQKPTKPSVQVENSVRRIFIDVQGVVDKFLGKSMLKTGKAAVIESMIGAAGASFNKYSGVQEWGSDAIFLWVNVGKKDDDIVNDFLNDGRQITWFGGSRMHEETPAILKLLRIGQRTDRAPAQDGIVLWCRHWNSDAKAYHPYTCLGRLSYQSHVQNSRPLQFVWNLLDYDRLVKQDNTRVRGCFQEIVNA